MIVIYETSKKAKRLYQTGERRAALGRQAVFLEAARGLAGNRPLNQFSTPNYLTKTRQIT